MVAGTDGAGPPPLTVVLLHGAWHGGWCWDAVVGELAARRVPSRAPDLPLTGYRDDVEVARRVIADAGPRCVVVAHSYGGLVLSEAASGLPNVAHLVYLAAIMADAGEDQVDLLAGHDSLLPQSLVFGDGTVAVDPDLAPALLYGDSGPDAAARAVARLRPMRTDGAAPTGRAEPAWKQVPSTYVICTGDRAMAPSAQRTMAQRATRTLEWPTDHSPFLTRPASVADLVTAGP